MSSQAWKSFWGREISKLKGYEEAVKRVHKEQIKWWAQRNAGGVRGTGNVAAL